MNFQVARVRPFRQLYWHTDYYFGLWRVKYSRTSNLSEFFYYFQILFYFFFVWLFIRTLDGLIYISVFVIHDWINVMCINVDEYLHFGFTWEYSDELYWLCADASKYPKRIFLICLIATLINKIFSFNHFIFYQAVYHVCELLIWTKILYAQNAKLQSSVALFLSHSFFFLSLTAYKTFNRHQTTHSSTPCFSPIAKSCVPTCTPVPQNN